jgi:hypothetical protein
MADRPQNLAARLPAPMMQPARARMHTSRRAWWFATLLGLGCRDAEQDSGDTESTSTADTSGTASMTLTTTSPTSDTADTTGGPDDALQPCDPLADECAPLRCGGAPTAGYYCRPTCSSMAQEGDACSDGGVCLPATPGSADMVCVVTTDCDPSTGSGCDLAAGESCVVVDVEPLRTACEPAGTGGVAEPCGPSGGNDCDVGLGCLGSNLDDGDAGRCTPWCEPPGDGGDACPVCVPIAEDLGSCAECSLIDDQCPEGSQCQPINEALGGFCIDYGPGGADDPCNVVDPAMGCQEGLLCLEVVDDLFVCVATCDPAMPMCDDPAKSCIDLGTFVPGAPNGEVGICIEGVQQFCDPDGDPTGCDPEEVCLVVGPDLGVCGGACDPTTGDAACEGNAACYPADGNMIDIDPFVVGNGVCGAGCTDDGDCGGGTCLLVEGLESAGVCGPTCDPSAPVCDGGSTCVATPGDPLVGACIVGGNACDGADPLSCAGMGAVACTVLDGGVEAVCMVACFEQDPNGCGGMAAACQVRSDADFHDGVCVGQEPACDPLMQDCDDEQTCVVTGGSALGGTAFVCSSAGPLAAGGDCTDDDSACGLGLQCVGDVCVELCDPNADDCARGTCTDASATLYLPAGSIGFCL